MATTASAAQWVKFFNTAGVPAPAAATYAHIFVENRIQTDMLMDLNKEYLREMGISPMGDIIAILRHAKCVSEQTARDKVLSSEIKVPVAAVQANVMLSTSRKIKEKPLINSVISRERTETPSPSTSDFEIALPKQPRRVLPEHEGRYKITLPSGTTQRSKEILAKKAMLYADRETEKVGVFDRLTLSDSSSSEKPQQMVRMLGFDKQGSSASSIFARLGGKNAKQDKKSSQISGILKNSTTKSSSGISKRLARSSQKVILVKKIPAKAATMVADDYGVPDKMETGEKSVSFSSEDEILEIAPRRVVVKPQMGVKSRLGGNGPQSQNGGGLHKTRKMTSFKPTFKKNAQIRGVGNTSRMKSDEILRKDKSSVRSRLDLSTRNGNLNRKPAPISHLVERIGKVKLTGTALKMKSSSKQQTSSVFDRLGRW